jgi:hypothetical protein
MLILLKLVLGAGRGRYFALDSTVHEQALSKRASNIFNFDVMNRLYQTEPATFNFNFAVLSFL